MGVFMQPSKPFHHEADSLEESCGITREAWDRFCIAFDETVGAARSQEPAKRSRDVEAFEKLMHRHPRELCVYIADLVAELAEQKFLRRVLRHLLHDPPGEPEKKDGLENLDCAGSA